MNTTWRRHIAWSMHVPVCVTQRHQTYIYILHLGLKRRWINRNVNYISTYICRFENAWCAPTQQFHIRITYTSTHTHTVGIAIIIYPPCTQTTNERTKIYFEFLGRPPFLHSATHFTLLIIIVWQRKKKNIFSGSFSPYLFVFRAEIRLKRRKAWIQCTPPSLICPLISWPRYMYFDRNRMDHIKMRQDRMEFNNKINNVLNIIWWIEAWSDSYYSYYYRIVIELGVQLAMVNSELTSWNILRAVYLLVSWTNSSAQC